MQPESDDERHAAISVFDMLKIGVGPSSSHTLGPWRAALAFVELLVSAGELRRVTAVRVELFGSLAKTGRGHGTGMALMMGLTGHDPVSCDIDLVTSVGPDTRSSGQLLLGGMHAVPFDRDRDLCFDGTTAEHAHPNTMTFTATLATGDAEGADDLADDGATSVAGETISFTAYSIGGGFITHGEPTRSGGIAVSAIRSESGTLAPARLPAPIDSAADLERWCVDGDHSIADVVRMNERTWRSDEEIDADLLAIRDVMLACIQRGCSTDGVLPGGLSVTRRAKRLYSDLFGRLDTSDTSGPSGPSGPSDTSGGSGAVGPTEPNDDPHLWFESLRTAPVGFDDSVALVSCFALAVNEENAAFGRVVTAPTNGAAGVIPAVMFHHLRMLDPSTHGRAELDAEAIRFLLVAAEIGAIFKKGSTISAALGGCQAEIGVSSAMAAAALTECRGGSVRQSLMAAEIAMEHHLGLTCDPIGGLVQVPCIERNAMGAIKGISASLLARSSDPDLARVSLDDVIDTMWNTALDMHAAYKETAEGGLAVRIPVNVVEC